MFSWILRYYLWVRLHRWCPARLRRSAYLLLSWWILSKLDPFMIFASRVISRDVCFVFFVIHYKPFQISSWILKPHRWVQWRLLLFFPHFRHLKKFFISRALYQYLLTYIILKQSIEFPTISSSVRSCPTQDVFCVSHLYVCFQSLWHLPSFS